SVMVHRSVIGSVERAVGHLVEVYDSAFPAWLAPLQVAVLPVSDAEAAYAEAVAARCADAGLRARVVGADRGSLAARVRQVRLAPYHAVVGAREAADDQVSVRLRDG